MRTRTLLSFLAAIGLVLPGCSGLRVTSDFDPAVDFSKYGSYAWLPRPDPTKDPEAARRDGLLIQRIERAVDADLSTKGMRRVEPDASPSLLVTEHISVEQKLQVNTTTYGYGYGRWGYYGGGYSDTYVDQYEEGTLVLDFIDAESKQLVWRGSVQTRLRDEKTPDERDRRVREVVQAILDRYPPPRK